MAAMLLAIQNLQAPASDLPVLDKTAQSSSAALNLTADREAASPASHTLRVGHTARSRQFLTTPANPIADVDLEDGQHSFTLHIGGDESTVTVSVNKLPGQVDTQEDFLRKLSSGINAKDSRIKSKVEYSFADAYDPSPRSRPLNRVARLRVYSTEEGRGADFYFSDQEGGSLVKTYGLDRAQPGRDLSPSQTDNAPSLDGGHVSGLALGSTDGPAEVTVGKSASAILAALEGTIQQYNSLVGFMSSHADFLRPSLKDRVIRPLEERSRELLSVGLRGSVQGYLRPTSAFPAQVEHDFGEVRRLLLDDGGWITALANKLEQSLAMDDQAFAAPLNHVSPFEERRRAWALIGDLGDLIISGYA